MYCPACGGPNADGARFCEKCGTTLSAEGLSSALVGGNAMAPGSLMASTSGAMQQAFIQGDPRMRGAGAISLGADGRRYAIGKNPTVAVLLALFLPLFPGVGQFYNGDIKKGFLILVGTIVGWWTSLFLFGLFLAIPLYFFAAFDSYRVASGKAPIW